MHVSSVPFITLFLFPFWIISLSCVDFAFLLSKFKHLRTHSVRYAFNSFYFFVLTYAVPHNDKAAQAGTGFRAACLCHDSAGCKRKECLLFWERVGEKGKACGTGMCVFDFPVLM